MYGQQFVITTKLQNAELLVQKTALIRLLHEQSHFINRVTVAVTECESEAI